MKQPFQILLVEDNQDDVELVEIQLKKLDLRFNIDIVDHQSEFQKILDVSLPDIIICDYNLPGFTGMEALEYVRERTTDLPFILVSGFIGEEKAIEAMRSGASDYVLKNNLERLIPAVQRELVNYREHLKAQKERDSAIQDLQERVKEQRCLYNISNLDDQTLSISELLQKAVHSIPEGFKFPNATEAVIEYNGKTFQTPDFLETKWVLHASTDKTQNSTLIIKVVYLEEKPRSDIGPFIIEERHLIDSIADILSLKINRILDKQQIEEKQELLEKTYNLVRIGAWEVNVKDQKIYWSPTTKKIHEVPDDFEPDIEKSLNFYKEGEDRETIYRLMERAIHENKSFDTELRIITAKGNEYWVRAIGEPEFEGGECIRVFGSIHDIDRRKRAEESLKMSEKRFKSLVQDGSDLISIIDSEGNYQYVSPSSQRIKSLGMEQDDFVGLNCFDFIHPNDRNRIRKTIDDLKPNEHQETGPYQFKNARGEWRWLESTITNLTETPAVNGYVANSRDVTDRIEQEKKFRDIVENSTNLFYRHDVNHVITYVSPQCEKFLGCSQEEAKKQWTEFMTDHPVNEKGYQKTIIAIQTGKAQSSYEMQLKRTDGAKMWVEVNEAPVVEDGKTVAMVGSLTDITSRKEYEEKLQELSLVASKTTDLIMVANTHQRITWVNKAFEQLTGYTLEESVGKLPSELLFGTDLNQEVLKKIDKKLEFHKTVNETVLIVSKEGKEYWMDTKIDPVFDNENNLTRYITIQKDVTDKIEKEKALQESVERYDIVTRATSDIIWDADLKTNTIVYNSNMYEVFGYNKKDIINTGAWWLNKVHPDDRERVNHNFNLSRNSRKDRFQIEYRFQCADGSYKYINDRAYIIKDENGDPVRIIGAMQDITKQKEENIWLKLLESAIGNTTEAIAILEEEKGGSGGREIIYVNNAFEQLTGYRKKYMLGRSLLVLVGPKTDRKAIVKGIRALDRGESYQLEISYSDKENQHKWAQISFAPVVDFNDKCNYWICIGRDITDRREREQLLRESLQEKETLLMEIHHRVKNNLAVVSSMMQLQAMEETNESLQKKLFDSVIRIRTMVSIHELLYESKSFVNIDMRENMEKLTSMILNTLQNVKHISINMDCDPVILNVNQAIPLSLIVNEVITNACKHAFPAKKKGEIKIVMKELDNTIKLSISDDGKGLPKGFTSEDSNSLGMKLIEVLSRQMETTYQLSEADGGGTLFHIQFVKNKRKGIGNAYLS